MFIKLSCSLSYKYLLYISAIYIMHMYVNKRVELAQRGIAL